MTESSTTSEADLLEALHRSEWQVVASRSTRHGYHSLSTALLGAADASIAAQALTEGHALKLLGIACKLTLDPNSYNRPFRPQSALDAYGHAEIARLSTALDTCTESWMSARLSDIDWTIRIPKDPAYAIRAIDEYCRIPIDQQSWSVGGYDAWQRAVNLARSLKKRAGTRFQDIEAKLVSQLHYRSPRHYGQSLTARPLTLPPIS